MIVLLQLIVLALSRFSDAGTLASRNFNPSSRMKVISSYCHHGQNILSVRGGEILGTSITKENLVYLYCTFCAANAVIGLPAPEVQANKVYKIPVREGSLDHLWFDYLISTSTGIGIALYLSVFKGNSAVEAIWKGGVPTTFITYKHWLKGDFKRFGFAANSGVAQTVFMLGCTYCMATGNWKPEIVAKIFVVPCLIFGTAAMIDIHWASNLYGMTAPTGQTRSIFYWYHSALLQFGVFASALLWGKSAIDAATYASIVAAATAIDCHAIRKTNGYVRTPKIYGLIFSVLFSLIAAGLALG
jgi:hypothetical protein